MKDIPDLTSFQSKTSAVKFLLRSVERASYLREDFSKILRNLKRD